MAQHRTTPNGRPAWRAARHSLGVSLVELTLVLTIIAVLGALAAPRFANASVRQRVAAAAQRIEADLAWAQQRARAESNDVIVQFNPDNTYQLITHDVAADQTIDMAVEPYGVSVGTTLDLGGSQITFNGYGLPDGGGTITITQGAFEVVLTIDSTTGAVSRP